MNKYNLSVSDPPKRKLHLKGVVSARDNLADDIFKIWIKVEGDFNFKAGQYCTLGLDEIERPYSIASSPSEAELELVVEVVPKPVGKLSPLLDKLKPGDTLNVRNRPKGVFRFDEKYTVHVMVSTVTGVAPYVSMLRDLAGTETMKTNVFHILQGASYVNEFGYKEELEKFASKNENVHYMPSISRPTNGLNEGWEGAIGRINTHLANYLQENDLIGDSTLVYACGNPGMIEDVRLISEKFNVGFKEERFWKD